MISAVFEVHKIHQKQAKTIKIYVNPKTYCLKEITSEFETVVGTWIHEPSPLSHCFIIYCIHVTIKSGNGASLLSACLQTALTNGPKHQQ